MYNALFLGENYTLKRTSTANPTLDPITTTQIFSKPIPQTILLIWFGPLIKPNYLYNIINWKKINPNFKVTLLSDPSTMPQADYDKLRLLCSKNSIAILEFQHLSEDDFPNYNIVKFELENKAWHRASDVARCSLLLINGGVYADTDIEPKNKIENLNASTGLLIGTNQDDNVVVVSFMAACVGHSFFQDCVDLLRETYNVLLKQANTASSKQFSSL